MNLPAGDKKSVDVALNVVPFVDLMSCLVAFLLVSAQWIALSRLQVEPTGAAREQPPCADGRCDDPRLSVLIEPDRIWVGVSRLDDVAVIPGSAAGHDWAALERVLVQHKASTYFADRTEIEIAADSTAAQPISYQTLIAAMDVAVKAGFVDVGVTEPAGLSWRPVR